MSLSSALVVRHLRFLIFLIAGALGNLFCIILPIFLEISHTVAKIAQFLRLFFF